MSTRPALLALALVTAGCREAPDPSPFPDPQRPVAPIVSPRYSNEDARDSAGEFEKVVELAGIQPGMSVADVGAGEGYYTVRLAPLVGADGRVLAQDIVPQTRDALAQRVTRERLRSEEHTSELQSLMRISYAAYRLQKKKRTTDSR